MIDDFGLDPGIFTPITVQLDRFYRGPPMSGQIVVFAGVGKIGDDETRGCAFGSTSLRIREGPDRVMIGGTYVMLFGKELLAGASEAQLSMPIVDNVFVVRDGSVVAMDGKREPLP